MNNQKISNDPVLDQVIYEKGDLTHITDPETGRTVRGLTRRMFRLSVPYRVGEIVRLARTSGLPKSATSFRLLLEEMTEGRITAYTRLYLIRDQYDRHPETVAMGVTPALYDSPQSALDGGLPLNAFEARGVIYQRREDGRPNQYPAEELQYWSTLRLGILYREIDHRLRDPSRTNRDLEDARRLLTRITDIIRKKPSEVKKEAHQTILKIISSSDLMSEPEQFLKSLQDIYQT